MSNYATSTEMTQMFERLRLQLKFRQLKTQFGSEAAREIVYLALRLEWSDLDMELPLELHNGSKKVPVRHQ